MANDFEIVAKVSADESSVQKQLSAKKYTIDASVKLDQSTINKLGADFRKISQTATLNVSAKLDGKSFKNVTKVVETWSDNQGRLAQVTKILSKDNQLLAESVSKVSEKLKPFDDGMGKVGKKIDSVSSKLPKVGKQVKSFGADMLDTAKKVMKFGAITAAIGMVTTVINQAIKSVFELDKAMVEFSKVSDLSGDSLNRYVEKLGDLGREVGRTAGEMVKSATEFKKSGYSDEDSARLSQIAELYRNIADAEITSGEASNFIISQMKAFNIEAKDALQIIDMQNEVSNNFAVSSSDISLALSKTSAAMSALGNTSSETIALVTSGSEIMTNQASKVARGLRTIGNNIANLAQTNKTLDMSVQGTTKSISLLDETTGDMRSTFDIMSDIYANGWNKMSNAEKQALAINLAGKNQFEVFISVLSNFDTALEANVTALNSQGSAMKENEKYMGGLEARVNKFKSEFEKLSNTGGILNEFTKEIVEFGTNTIETFNNVAPILLSFKDTMDKLPFLTWSKRIGIFMDAVNFIGKGIKKINGMDNISSLELFEGAVKNQEELNDELQSTEEKLKTIQAQIDEINNNNGAEVRQEELEVLTEQEESLKRQIALLDLKNQKAITEKQESANKFLESSTDTTTAKGDKWYSPTEIKAPKALELEGQVNELSRMKAELKELEDATLAMVDANGKLKDDGIFNAGLFQAKSEQMEKLKAEIVEYGSANITFVEQMNEALDSLSEEDKTSEYAQQMRLLVDAYFDLMDIQGDSGDAKSDEQKSVEELAEEYGIGAEAIRDYMSANEVSAMEAVSAIAENEAQAQSISEVADAYQDAISQVSAMAGSFGSLTDAVADYNANGSFSLETLDKLLGLGSEYLSLLEVENGQMSLNTDGALALANAKIDQAQALAIAEAQTKLDAIAKGQLASAEQTAGSAGYSAVGGISSVGNAAMTSGLNALNAVNNWNSFWKAMTRKTIKSGGKVSEINKVGNDLKNQLSVLEKARGSLGKYTSVVKTAGRASGGGAKAVNKQNDALKEQQKILQDLVNDYKSVISYINGKIDDQIDKLEELKDSALDGIKAQIEAIEEQRDVEEKFWDNKIDALKEQNDELESQIELEKLLQNLALAKTKKVRIYKEGEGFVWGEDNEAINKAQQDIAEYNRKKKQENELKELEKLRDEKLKNYDKQIEDLKEQSKRIEQEYDAQIQYFKTWKENFKNQTDAYQNEQDRLLALQLTGIDFENANWVTRLDNLAKFIAEYKAKQQELANITEQANQSASSSTSGGGGGGGGGYSGGGFSAPSITPPPTKPYDVFEVFYASKDSKEANMQRVALGNKVDGVTKIKNDYLVYKKLKKQFQKENEASTFVGKLTAESLGRKKYGYKQFASGVAQVQGDQWAITGENPNKEIVIGSKLNNGTMTKIDNGGGVVNAKGTTLAGLFNTLGSMSGVNKSVDSINNNHTNSQSSVYNIGEIVLNDIKDGKGFVEYLQNFSATMSQESYK